MINLWNSRKFLQWLLRYNQYTKIFTINVHAILWVGRLYTPILPSSLIKIINIHFTFKSRSVSISPQHCQHLSSLSLFVCFLISLADGTLYHIEVFSCISPIISNAEQLIYLLVSCRGMFDGRITTCYLSWVLCPSSSGTARCSQGLKSLCEAGLGLL